MVVTISMVIGAATIMNFTGGERSNAVSRSATLIVTKVRSVQNRATTVAEGNGDVPCGYGVHHQDEASFKIFSIEPGDKECEEINFPGSGIDNRKYDPTNDNINLVDLEEVKLKKPTFVKIRQEFDDVYFVPPEGLVFIDGERATGDFSEIVVCERNRCSKNNQKVKISVGGEIILEK